MSAPRAAVVVPCWNDGETVPDTVSSALGQDCELVVVDDGSTDPATLEVLDRLRAEGVHVLRVENGGVAAARMAGVAVTSAPYVLPLDADDQLVPGAIAALADALDANPRAAGAWGWIESFGEQSSVGRMAPRLDPWLVTYINLWPAMSLYRREALLEAGGWRSGVDHEDWDLWQAFAERGWEGVRVPRVVARYRVRGGRRWSEGQARYGEAVERFRRDHAPLFAARPANWRRSRAPWHLKLAYPVIDRLPLSPYDKRRLFELTRRPLYVPANAIRRRAASGRR